MRRIDVPLLAPMHSDVAQAMRSLLGLLYQEQAISGFVFHSNEDTGVHTLTIEPRKPPCDHRYEDHPGGGVQCIDCGHIEP